MLFIFNAHPALLLFSALHVSLAANCNSSPQAAGFDENELWILRQRMCGDGACPNALGSYCYLVQTSLPYASGRYFAGGSQLSSLGGGENSSVPFPYCFDALENIITQCWRKEKVAQGVWTYGGQSYTIGMQDIVTRSAIETFIASINAPTQYSTIYATGFISPAATARSTSLSSAAPTSTLLSSNQSSAPSAHSVNIRAAVGGALGGGIVLLTCVLVLLVLLKRRTKKRKLHRDDNITQLDPKRMSEMRSMYGESKWTGTPVVESGGLKTGIETPEASLASPLSELDGRRQEPVRHELM